MTGKAHHFGHPENLMPSLADVSLLRMKMADSKGRRKKIAAESSNLFYEMVRTIPVMVRKN
jgi:hypothetical protein